mmetsp:Transcript_19973/g.41722  ORF Transcript_19973/g.41722 Transcript_19973/m.41722 type:complete len:208 (-) Transcript_19973:256-879(-)
MLENFWYQNRRRNGFGFIHSARLNHLFQILRQSRQCSIHIVGCGHGLFGLTFLGTFFHTIVQMQGRQIATHGKEITRFHVHVTEITHAHGFVKFSSFQGQRDAMIGTSIAKDIPAQTTMVTTSAHGKGLFTIGTFLTQDIRHLLDGEFQSGQGIGKVYFLGGIRLTVIGHFLLIRSTPIITAVATHGNTSRFRSRSRESCFQVILIR